MTLVLPSGSSSFLASDSFWSDFFIEDRFGEVPGPIIYGASGDSYDCVCNSPSYHRFINGLLGCAFKVHGEVHITGHAVQWDPGDVRHNFMSIIDDALALNPFFIDEELKCKQVDSKFFDHLGELVLEWDTSVVNFLQVMELLKKESLKPEYNTDNPTCFEFIAYFVDLCDEDGGETSHSVSIGLRNEKFFIKTIRVEK